MRGWVGIAAAVALAGGCGGGESSAPRQPSAPVTFELATYYPEARRGHIGTGSSLRAVDPATLRPLTRRGLRLGGYATDWRLSPDRRTLAVGQSWGELALVDLAERRLIARMRLTGAPGEDVWPVGWPGRDLLVAHVCVPLKLGCTGNQIVLVDPERRRVRARIDIGEATWRYDERGKRAVFLAGPEARSGHPSLIVVDRLARVRRIQLSRLTLGWSEGPLGPHVRTAALALDRPRGRAIVVSPGEPIAVVNLTTLRVEYRRVRGLDPDRRTLGRAYTWTGTVEPYSSSGRRVDWLRPDLLRVNGDERRLVAPGKARDNALATRILDIRTWRARPALRWERGLVAGELLLVAGPRRTRGDRYVDSFTLTAHERPGRVRYRIAVRSPAHVTWNVFRHHLYLGDAGGYKQRVYDLRSGRLLHRFRSRDVAPAFRWVPPR